MRNSGGTGRGGPVAMGVHASEVIRLLSAAATVGWSATSSSSPEDESVSEDSDKSEETRRSLASNSFTSWRRKDGNKADSKGRVQED